jgi:hypothetical protein
MPIAILLALIAIAVFFVANGVPSNMTKDQISTLAQNAGFTGDDINTAAAIALAESGGNAHAYNPETEAGTPQGQGSFGLWQIYLKAHPEFFGWALYDPQVNANAAFKVYADAGNSFTPWSTYKNGMYEGHL